jgi:peroxiredoxin
MRPDIVPGATVPDFELPDQDGVSRRLSELQGDDPLVLSLGRGEHCPRERQHQRELIKLHEWCAVAFTGLVTVLPNDLHDVYRLRISTGAYWPFLADADLTVQTMLDIREYTDSHHAATVPHTVVLAPGLVVDKIYVGYWFWGRPSAYDLWRDLRDLTRRIRPDYDPLVPEVRDAYLAVQR